MKFSLFRKSKQSTESENPSQEVPPQEEKEGEKPTATQEPTQPPVTQQEQATEKPENTPPPTTQKTEAAESSGKTYLKAMPLKELADVEKVKEEVRSGNIVILRVTPLANKNLDDVKNAVSDLYQFSESMGGDIARLGEERVVICPKNVRIWREKTPGQNEALPTAA